MAFISNTTLIEGKTSTWKKYGTNKNQELKLLIALLLEIDIFLIFLYYQLQHWSLNKGSGKEMVRFHPDEGYLGGGPDWKNVKSM